MIEGKPNSMVMMATAELIAQGNPGCMTMLVDTLKKLSLEGHLMCLRVLLSFEILGADAYRLWNDACDRNTFTFAELLFKLKVGAIPVHVVRESLAEVRASKLNLQQQLPYAPWMDSFSLESIELFGRDVLAPVPEKKGE